MPTESSPKAATIEGRRAVIVSERRVEFERTEVGATPEGSHVRLKVERSIISAGTELSIYTGLDAGTRIPGEWAAWPFRSGYGGVGRVVAAGPDAVVPAGTRVFGILNHTSDAVIDSAKNLCVPIPEALDSTRAALARLGCVALTAARRVQSIGTPLMGSRVLVIGLGLVGNLAGQLCRVTGARVTGLDPSAHRGQIAGRCGFVGALEPSVGELSKAVASLLGGAPDVVIEAVGDSRLIEQAIGLCRPGGSVVLLGSPRAPHQTEATASWREVHFKSLQVLGAFEYGIPFLRRQDHGAVGRDITIQDNADLVLRLMSDGSLVTDELVTAVPPANLGEAYEGLLNRKDEFLGVVFDWENNPLPEATFSESK